MACKIYQVAPEFRPNRHRYSPSCGCSVLHASGIDHDRTTPLMPIRARMLALCLFTVNRRPKTFTCEEVCNDVLLMNTLAKERRAKRFENGSLSLNVPKLTFKLDDNGNPIEFGSYPIRDSNKLVEVGSECSDLYQNSPRLFLEPYAYCAHLPSVQAPGTSVQAAGTLTALSELLMMLIVLKRSSTVRSLA